MILQPSVSSLLAALVSEFRATGKPFVPAGRRDELVKVLLSAAIGSATVGEYSAMLAAAFGTDPVPPEAPDDLPRDAILQDGPGVLSDDQLARLALSPPAFLDLSRRVEDALASGTAGECWVRAELLPDEAIPPEYHAAAERAVAEALRVERLTRPGTEPSSTE